MKRNFANNQSNINNNTNMEEMNMRVVFVSEQTIEKVENDRMTEDYRASKSGEYFVLELKERECILWKFEPKRIWNEVKTFEKSISLSWKDWRDFIESEELRQIINKALRYVPKQAQLLVEDYRKTHDEEEASRSQEEYWAAELTRIDYPESLEEDIVNSLRPIAGLY